MYVLAFVILYFKFDFYDHRFLVFELATSTFSILSARNKTSCSTKSEWSWRSSDSELSWSSRWNLTYCWSEVRNAIQFDWGHSFIMLNSRISFAILSFEGQFFPCELRQNEINSKWPKSYIWTAKWLKKNIWSLKWLKKNIWAWSGLEIIQNLKWLRNYKSRSGLERIFAELALRE